MLGVVADDARAEDFDAILARYREPATPQEELRYLNGLAQFPDVALSMRTFELALSEVRTQNAPYVIGALLGNRVAGPAAWERLKGSWERVLDRFPVNSHSRMLGGVRLLCGDPALADDVATFLTEHPLPSGQRSVDQALERLQVNVAFGSARAGSPGCPARPHRQRARPR